MTEARIGCVLSAEMRFVGGADVVGTAEGNTCYIRHARLAGPPGVVDHMHVRKHLSGTGRAAVSPSEGDGQVGRIEKPKGARR